MDQDDREWLRKRLHSEEMQCKQCRLINELLDKTE